MIAQPHVQGRLLDQLQAAHIFDQWGAAAHSAHT